MDFHMMQMRIAAGICVFALVLVAVLPKERGDFFKEIALVTISFLFGKFTNGFQRRRATRWDDEPKATENKAAIVMPVDGSTD